MRYLATPSGERVRAVMRAGLLDCMTTPRQGNVIPDGCMIGADNSRFGTNGDGRSWPGYERWYDWLCGSVERYGAHRFRFAVAPDVPFSAAGTLRESLPWLAAIRELGIPAAFAAQNGCDLLGLPWSEFDVLFLAGGPENGQEWKESETAMRLTDEAHDRGLQVHMGRVNSLRRLRIAERHGCDTADGTYLKHGPDVNLPQLLDWLDEIDATPSLFTATSAVTGGAA